jgi:hypothetical protein
MYGCTTERRLVPATSSTIIRRYITKCTRLSVIWTPKTASLEPPWTPAWTPEKGGSDCINNISTVKLPHVQPRSPTTTIAIVKGVKIGEMQSSNIVNRKVRTTPCEKRATMRAYGERQAAITKSKTINSVDYRVARCTFAPLTTRRVVLK